jgi:hypothetical protein
LAGHERTCLERFVGAVRHGESLETLEHRLTSDKNAQRFKTPTAGAIAGCNFNMDTRANMLFNPGLAVRTHVRSRPWLRSLSAGRGQMLYPHSCPVSIHPERIMNLPSRWVT